MSQCIRTRYIPAGRVKPARMQASCEAKTVYLSYEDGINSDENHAAVRDKLIKAMKWGDKKWVSGTFKGDDYHVVLRF